MSQALTNAELQQQLAAKLAEVERLQKELAKRGKKRSRPVDQANDDEEKAAEPAPKRQKTELVGNDDQKEPETASESDYEDADAEMEDVLADGSCVAVAYGNLNGLSRRRWYAAKIGAYNAETGLYTVVWKFPPRTGAKKSTFECAGDRLREITDADYKNAPDRGTGYVGLHRASTFVVQPEEESEDEGVQVGDHVAVAYGAARANKKGSDPSAGRDPKKFHKRFLWYAATVTEVDENDVTVAWAVPFSKKDAKLPIDERSASAYFQTTQDKVQPITAKEFKKSKRSQKAKKTYGLVGIHRMATKADLTSAN